ncbi:MAG: septation regulator SpoVG [Bdellovibrionales bacterium]
MDITDIKVHPVNEEKLKAYVTIIIEGCFVVRDIKIIAGTEGLFVAMPSKRRKDGQFKDIVHPLNKETREKIEKLIFDEYKAQIKSMESSIENI